MSHVQVLTGPRRRTGSRPATRTGPTPAQREAVWDVLRHCTADSGDVPVTVGYVPHRKREATWLCAYGRAAGLTVRLLGIGRDSAASVAAALSRWRSADGGALVVLADTDLADTDTAQPPGAIHLFGTDRAGPFDLWTSPEEAAASVDRLRTDLGERPIRLRGNGSTLSAEPVSVRRGRYPGTAEVAVRAASGVFVADCCLAVNRPATWDARLADHPVTVELADGTVLSVSCDEPVKSAVLRRVVDVHMVDRVELIRFGLRDLRCPVSAVAGAANEVRTSVAIDLTVALGRAYLAGSADLRLSLRARWDGELR